MSSASDTFFTSVGCMDGRVQDVVAKFGQEKFGAQFPDTITEAGLVGKLNGDVDKLLLDSLKFKIVDVSLGKHHSKGIIVHGHQECAGNPVDDNTHKQDVLNSAKVVRSMAPDVEIIPVFVVKQNNGWEVEVISE